MGKCKKCGCQGFFWNPGQAIQKLFSGNSVQYKLKPLGVGVEGQFKGMPQQNNKSNDVAYRSCTCGHHYNYHDK